MGWWAAAAYVLDKLPIEKMLAKPPDPKERLQRLRAALEPPKGAAAVTTARPGPTPQLELPTTAETVWELKKRLGKELYKMELDLADGGRIAGKPCDCLGKKHRLGLEATAEELMSYEHNPVHGQVIAWLGRHGAEFEPAEIAQHDPEHYRALIPEVRAFRKQVMGTEKLGPILSGGNPPPAAKESPQPDTNLPQAEPDPLSGLLPMEEWLKQGDSDFCRSCILPVAMNWYYSELEERGRADLAQQLETVGASEDPAAVCALMDAFKANADEALRNRLREFDWQAQHFDPDAIPPPEEPGTDSSPSA